MNRTCALLLHHWRRTRLWVLLPLLVSVAWTITVGSDIWHSRSLDTAWDEFHVSMMGNVLILVVGTLGLVVAMGSGESNAAFPRYAQTLPVSDRRWSLSYILYSLLVLSLLAGIITVIDWQVWHHAVAADKVRVAAAQQRHLADVQKAQAETNERQMAPLEEVPLTGNAMSPDALRRAKEKAVVAPDALRRAEQARMAGRFAPATARVAAPRKAPAPSRRFQPWAYYSRWKEVLFFVSVVFFSQSLLVALSLIPRVPIRVFAIAVALVVAPAAGLFLSLKIFHHSGWAVGFWIYLLLFGAVITHRAAKRERHGGLGFQRAADLLGRQVGNPRLGFSSPQRALAWYDWMTFGRYLIYGTVGIAIACRSVGAVDSSEITGVLILPACALAGLYLAYRLYYGDRYDHDAYLVTLPITVERLSKSRMVNVSKAAAAAFVVAILLETTFITWDYGAPEESTFILFAPAFAWVLVWLAGPLFYAAIAAWLFALPFTMGVALLLPRSNHEEIFALFFVGLLSLFVLTATIWLVRRAKHRGLLAPWNKRLAIAAWFISATVSMPILWEELHKPYGPIPYVLALALCLLAAVPFLALPLAIDRYRHR